MEESAGMVLSCASGGGAAAQSGSFFPDLQRGAIAASRGVGRCNESPSGSECASHPDLHCACVVQHSGRRVRARNPLRV